MFEELKAIIAECFDKTTIPFYLLGIIVYFITILDDLRNNEKLGFVYYLQDFLYSMIAVTIGISSGHLIGLPKAAYWIITIGCAFLGSTIFRKLDSNKERLSDKFVDKASDKIADATLKKISNCISKDSNDAINENENNCEE